MRTKNIKEKIREYFLKSPTEKLRVRQIEKTLRLPLPSIIRYTKELEMEGLLKRTKTSGVSFYSADRASKNFVLEKKLFNIKQLYLSGLIEELKKEFSSPTIIVFGSYSKGEDIESSDVDLFIETPGKKQTKLEKYEKILGRKIQIFSHKNIHEIKNRELANNILNGVVLNGFIEVFR